MTTRSSLVLRVALNLVNGATRPLQNILSNNNRLQSSLTATRSRLTALGATQRDIGAFRELRTGMQATETQLQAAQARVAQLAQGMRAAGTPTQAMTREFERAKRAAAALRTTHEQQTLQLQQLRTRLSGAGIDTRRLAQHELTLRNNIDAATRAMQQQQRQLAELAARERRVNDARNRMQATQGAAGNMAGTGAGMLAAGVATGAALRVPVSAFAQAEDAATGLQVSMMRAGAVIPPEFEKINALAMKLGDRLPGATSDFQDMMTMLNRQGISATSILGGMGEATAYLGVQLKKSPADAAEFAAKLQDATRTSEKDMMSLMDVIQRTFYLGVDDNNMLQAFSKLSPALDTIKKKGLEGAQALAPLVVMADQAGIQGEAAGNAFRKIFQMSMDPKKIAKANKELEPGKRLQFTKTPMEFTDGKGEFGGLDNMFKQMEKLKSLTTQKRLTVLKELFGDDAETLGAVALLMDKGAAGYAEVQAKMAAQASLQQRVNKQLGTLKSLWESAAGTFTNGMVAFGEAIAPEMKATTEWLGEMAQKMGAWARENPRMAGGLMKMVAVLALLLTVGGGLVLMLAAVLGPLAMVRFSMVTLGMQGGILARVLGFAGGALRLVGQAALWMGRAMMMNPIGLAIAAIAGGAYLIWKYWEPIKGFFVGLWDQVKAAFAGGIGSMSSLLVNWSPLGLFYKAFAGVMSWFGVTMPSTFTGFGANLVTGLVNGIVNGMGAVKAAIMGLGDNAVTWFKTKLGIHSPSRVFGQLGGFIGQGAALGMSGEKGKVNKAAAALALAASAGFAPPALAGPQLADTLNKAAANAPQVATQAALSVVMPKLPPEFAAIAGALPNLPRSPADAAAAALPVLAQQDKSGTATAVLDAIARNAQQPMIGQQVPIDTRPPIAAPMQARAPAPAPAGGTTINIYAAPGMDPQAIARAVSAELDKRERMTQSRIGSRLND